MRVRTAGLIRISDAILLVEHEKEGNTYWLLPGGGILPGEKAREALGRELREELGVDCDVKELLFVVEAIGDGGRHLVQTTFEVSPPDMGKLKVGGDRRVRRFGLFGERELGPLAIYPDIRSELQGYLKDGTVKEKYLLKRWVY